jgi:large subunit ribosomal protein L15
MQLNELKDNQGSRHRKMRVGRGIGSGKGKTSGRGGKGQTARTGVAINGFEGGQTPIHRRLPKRGFNNFTRTEYPVVNIGGIQKCIDAGTLDAKKAVTLDALKNCGLLRPNDSAVKLLAKGALKVAVKLEVTLASKSAIAAVEKAGGSVQVQAQAQAS